MPNLPDIMIALDMHIVKKTEKNRKQTEQLMDADTLQGNKY